MPAALCRSPLATIQVVLEEDDDYWKLRMNGELADGCQKLADST